jgi:hypothetical protein
MQYGPNLLLFFAAPAVGDLVAPLEGQQGQLGLVGCLPDTYITNKCFLLIAVRMTPPQMDKNMQW